MSLSTASSAGERSEADELQGVAALGGAVLTTGDAVAGVLSGGFGVQLRPGVALAEISRRRQRIAGTGEAGLIVPVSPLEIWVG